MGGVKNFVDDCTQRKSTRFGFSEKARYDSIVVGRDLGFFFWVSHGVATVKLCLCMYHFSVRGDR